MNEWESPGIFDGGLELRGPGGLDLMSVSCRMTSPVPDLFQAQVRTATFGDVMVARTRAQHLVAERTTDMLDDFYSDQLQIGFRLQGRTHTDQQRRSFDAGVDHVALLFPGDTFTSVITRPTEVVQFYLPTRHLTEHGFSARDVGGRAWGPSALVTATRQFLLGLTTGGPTATPATQPGFVSRALTELGLGLLYELRDQRPPVEDFRDATRVRVRAFVATHAHEPDLSVDQVAAHVGTSRRFLQNLFADETAGVGQLIRTTRVQHAAQRLLSQPPLTVGRVAAASGFRGPDQLSRAFQSVYGVTPSEYRRQRAPSTFPDTGNTPRH